MLKRHYHWILISLAASSSHLQAHPTGNIVLFKDHVFWPYVSPVGDINHHACIMRWNKKSSPSLFFVSENSASDFVMYADEAYLYILESRYVHAGDYFESRLLISDLIGEPRVIWPWFRDPMKIGQNGFYVRDHEKIIFAHYPSIYVVEQNQEPRIMFEFERQINRIRKVGDDRLLLLGENQCWLTDQVGNILYSWDELLNDDIPDAPLDLNRIYDADYHQGDLLIAYWGKRSFEVLTKNSQRSVIKQDTEPWVPHWVAFDQGKMMLFSSYLDFDKSFKNDGSMSTIKPRFEQYENGQFTIIWQ